MFDAKSLDDLAHRLANSLPTGLHHLRDDLEKNFRAIVQNSLAKMELVTREEFEVQRSVLARTREKLEVLEEQVARMEKDHLPK